MNDLGLKDLFEGVVFDESIAKYEYHGYLPYSSTSLDYNDEIRICINKTDIYTHPCESFLYIEGEFKTVEENKTSALTNNGLAFLFSELRFELNGVELDRSSNPGVTSTLKGYASFNGAEKKFSEIAGWHNDKASTAVVHKNSVNACIPLRYLMGFFEDYRKLLINAKQELVLIRARHDKNVYKGDESVFKITKLSWNVPHVLVSDAVKIQIYHNMEKDIYIPFRQWCTNYQQLSKLH